MRGEGGGGRPAHAATLPSLPPGGPHPWSRGSPCRRPAPAPAAAQTPRCARPGVWGAGEGERSRNKHVPRLLGAAQSPHRKRAPTVCPAPLSPRPPTPQHPNPCPHLGVAVEVDGHVDAVSGDAARDVGGGPGRHVQEVLRLRLDAAAPLAAVGRRQGCWGGAMVWVRQSSRAPHLRCAAVHLDLGLGLVRSRMQPSPGPRPPKAAS
jgi:hypothetical protein